MLATVCSVGGGARSGARRSRQRQFEAVGHRIGDKILRRPAGDGIPDSSFVGQITRRSRGEPAQVADAGTLAAARDAWKQRASRIQNRRIRFGNRLSMIGRPVTPGRSMKD